MQQFVIFDLFHTLVPGADQERDRVVATMAGIVGVEPAAFVRAHHDSCRQRFTGWGTAETIRILAGRLGAAPSDEQIDRAVAHRHAFIAGLLRRIGPDTIAVLDRLRAAGTRLALVSNATADTAHAWRTTELAARFMVTVFSCELGVAKPDPGAYLAATTALGASPDACVFVGDGQDTELAGAAALGMRVVRTTEHNDSDPGWPGPTIAGLAELPALLGLAA